MANRDRPFVPVWALCHLCLQLPQPGLAFWDPCSRHVPDARSPVLTLPQMWTSVWILARVGMPAARTYLVPTPACVRRGSLLVPRRRAAKVLQDSWRGRRASLWEEEGGRGKAHWVLPGPTAPTPVATTCHRHTQAEHVCWMHIQYVCVYAHVQTHALRSTHACFMTNTCPTVHTPWLTLPHVHTHLHVYTPWHITGTHVPMCIPHGTYTLVCSPSAHSTMFRPHGTHPCVNTPVRTLRSFDGVLCPPFPCPPYTTFNSSVAQTFRLLVDTP